METEAEEINRWITEHWAKKFTLEDLTRILSGYYADNRYMFTEEMSPLHHNASYLICHLITAMQALDLIATTKIGNRETLQDVAAEAMKRITGKEPK